MIKTIDKMILIYFKGMLMTILRTNAFEKLLK